MEPIPFSKLSGSGNDFILIDNRDRLVDPDDCLDFVVGVCRRAISVGADGVILIQDDPQGECDFTWRFFNADGSEAQMCGNGGRCAALFAHDRKLAGEKMSFRTLAGVIRAEITGPRTTKLQLTVPNGYIPKIKLDINDGIELAFIDTGVPHTIIEVRDAEAIDVQKQGSKIRYHDRFLPQGANANFVQVTGDDSLIIRTYERGCEGETLACGTGAVAAAITMALKGAVRPPVKLTTRSGEILTVHFESGSKPPKEVFFEGAIRWVYDGRLFADSYK